MSSSAPLSVYNPDELLGIPVLRGVVTASVYDHLGVPHVATFQAWSRREWELIPPSDRPERVVVGDDGIRMSVQFDRA
jgi:hypothetical protein